MGNLRAMRRSWTFGGRMGWAGIIVVSVPMVGLNLPVDSLYKIVVDQHPSRIIPVPDFFRDLVGEACA